ncbi:tRNA nucleotidyltransferase (CCA-adding enzyme) [Paenibacillus sp. ov031]|uniref:CCA tRNA nucleotidyltransferase n=1 Tax=unclassified Paenibacillus TaxID=185978 RepID=UPI00089D1545|nr:MULTISPECIES: CCA tRNA nucleotidyltransferase [unclassified Paenibacillus]SEA84879.1 tRNA nucleotidyltransferase (CCA-adding enzyme) [Paenibacillus sp. 276b]SHN64149.1 tRNA nucleotidyltransferase (CCA-adding enzyme) [Paenibacillus sp. ov031]
MVQWTQVDHEMARQSEQVLRTLNETGYEAYWVGGCVRDELLERSVDDMDITTSASPEQVMELFADCIPTGLQHGTVTVRSGGFYFEVTTFRTESEYKDNRRPTAVQFVQDVKEDLQRRDFTMNALAMDRDGNIVDPFGGQSDIQDGRVRCVGSAAERFGEDALRMLRCVRFASVFDFKIAYNTWKGLVRQKDLLQHIAMERVRTEMVKMMAGPHPLRGLELLFRSQALEHVKAPISMERFNKALMSNMEQLKEENVLLRWSMVLIAGHYTRDEADALLRKWTFSNDDRSRINGVLQVEQLIQTVVQEQKDEETLRSEWIVTVLSGGRQATEDWLIIQQLLPTGWRDQEVLHEEQIVLIQSRGAAWSQSMKVHELKDLHITGENVLQLLGRKGGPWLGQLMKHLLRETAIGNIANQHDMLTNEVKRVAADDKA